jgi:uncharacterized protein (TIGR00375 family)
MRLVADLHIHSRYSRATSPAIDLPALDRSARRKGIDVLGTGDFTHPDWLSELEAGLDPLGSGLFRHGATLFALTSEIAAIWRQEGCTRKVHLVVLSPSFSATRRINRELSRLGNLDADGRPVFGAAATTLLEAIWNAAPTAEVIPAHIWTPWFSLFGSRSGFDSLEACFGPYTDRIFAVETGLSSDPPMNWRCSALDRLALVSSSDAHSPPRLGREATVFDLPEPGYGDLIGAMKTRDPKHFLGTIEFFPQEGKYHYDGHRACDVVLSPHEAAALEGRCPVCGKPLTIGVLHRIEDLADRAAGEAPRGAAPFRSVIPLAEVVSQALGIGPTTKGVNREVDRLVDRFGSEFAVLLDLPIDALADGTPKPILERVASVRTGRVAIEPGYDGRFGQIRIPARKEDPDDLRRR